MKYLYSLRSFLKPYWRQSIAALILLLAVVVMDLAIPRLIQRIIDDGIEKNDLDVVISTTVIMLTLSVLSALFAIGNNYLSVSAGEGFARDLREEMFKRVQDFSFGNLDHLRTGQLIVRFTSDIAIVQRVVRLILRIGTRAPFLMVGSLVLMFSTNRNLAFSVLPLLLITGALLVFFVLKFGGMFMTVQQKLDALNTVLQENISGVRVVKAFVRTDYENGRFENANEAFTNRNIRVMQFMSTLFPALTGFMNIGIVVVIWYGGFRAIEGAISLGEIVAFINYLLTTMVPLMIMGMLSHALAAGIASAERIREVLDEEPEVRDAEGVEALPEIIEGRVVFKNVKFHYNGASDETVLDGINLVAEPGQTVALLGATGSGKSTLIHLIPRFYDVTGGQVLIDGEDVRNIQQGSLLAKIGIVPQETVLFSGTARENIRYGRPEATDEEVVEAAMAAQAHDFILRLPNGYDTRVEQRGVNLSGGQKQRIAIARALLMKPKILILDDSTSSVDVETETKIQEALDAIMQGRTTFVVAQRISTVLNADKIVVLDKGKIASEGTHAELMQTSPIYQEIFDSQLGAGLVLDEIGR